MTPFQLTAPQRRALDALCRRVVPAAYEAAPAGLAAAVEARLAGGDPVPARQVAALLTVFDQPLVGLLTRGRPRRFSRLPPQEQDAALRSWQGSRLGVRRAVFQALRRLIVSTWYAQPEAQRGIGWRGPLHARVPEVAWEGPAPGAPRGDEPVARAGGAPGAASAGEAPRGIAQGHELGAETTLRADVCVVGSGIGGATAAARLAELGHEVVVLEEGSWWRPSDFTGVEAEMTPRLYADAAMRATRDLSLSILQGRGVGGGSLVNWLIMLRTPDHVLEEWAREHGAEGMNPGEMAPVFDLVEEETHARLVPDDAHSPSNRALLDGARRLGWSARAARINTRGCVRAGVCGLGCPHDAKQGAASVYLPRALRAGGRLYSDVRVDRVEPAERGGAAPLKRVHGTVLDRETGLPRGRLVVEAPVVVAAAGAVGTPALLLRSGLGGRAVGRFLRLHPTTAVVGLHEREMYAATGIPLSAVCDEFQRGERGYGFWIECPPLYPALTSAVVPGFGAAHRERMEQFPRLAPMIVLVRDGADTRLSSGDVRVDRRGRPVLRYRLGDADRRTLQAGIRATARLQLAAGAREVATMHTRERRLRSEADLALLDGQDHGPNQVTLLSAHVNGSCRLGADRRTGACTPDGELRGVPGLYVADGSLLPTAPGVNPQETIMAVATVVARRIADRHPVR